MRPVIGYNYGAGERERVSRIFQVALALCACIMMIGTVLCLALCISADGTFHREYPDGGHRCTCAAHYL